MRFRELPKKEKAACLGIGLMMPFLLPARLIAQKGKQIVASALTVAILCTSLPLSAFAAEGPVAPGDVNSDGKISMKDVLDFKKHLAGHEVSFDKVAADVNVDGTADLADLLMIKKYLAGWDVKLGEGQCVISFNADGGNAVESVSLKAGTKLAKTPVTAKEGYTFLGWETEDGQPFYAEDEIVASMTLIAKYEAMEPKDNLTLTTFTQMDQAPELSFVVVGDASLTAEKVQQLLSLAVIDGSAPVALTVAKNADGSYTVAADGGFNEGCSYTLTLSEGLSFKDKEASIRNASFTIDKEEVANLKYNDDLNYIKDTDTMTYTLGSGEVTEVLDLGGIENNTADPVTGRFEYDGASALKTDEILCIYETVDPRERDMKAEELYREDSVAFIRVTAISGKTVSFVSMDEGDAMDVLFMPDTLPFQVGALPVEQTGTVDSVDYDAAAWGVMGKTGAPVFDVGDFVVFYTGAFADMSEDSEVYYGEVTAIDGTTLTYKQTTSKAIEASMDVFTNTEVPGEELLKDVDEKALTEQVTKQMLESGFAVDSARYLAQMALQTDSVQDVPGLAARSVTKADGTPLTAKEMKAIGGSINLTDDVKLTVELDKSSKYFGDGVRLAVGIEAEFSVEMTGGEMKIMLNATFVEEIAIKVNVKANAKIQWHVIIPVLVELGMTTNVDVKNYSGLSLEAKIYTVANDDLQIAEEWDDFKELKETFDKIADLKEKIEQAKDTVDKLNKYKEDLKKLLDTVTGEDEVTFKELAETFSEMNITNDLKELLNITDEAELDAGVRDLMEQYCELLEQECDWVEVLRQEVFAYSYKFYQVIAVGIQMDFIISAKVNIALGTNMEYVVGKRYSFWFDIISGTAGSSQMDILDERFAFQFYVMGSLGMRMGLELQFAVGLFDLKLNSVGITAEFGPYVELYGYFVYEYSQLRPANSNAWEYDERMLGALYLEFGLYVEVTFKAQIGDGKLTYEPTLFDAQYPLLEAGTRRNIYDFGYEVEEDEVLRIIDEDGDGGNGYTMELPESYRVMSYVDLQVGLLGKSIQPLEKYNYSLSNRNFSYDPQTGKITAVAPEGVSYMKCDLTLTWKPDKLAFSLYGITSTIHLVWTNLSAEELKEPFTAAVKVGNEKDGYTTVWSERVIKNEPFNLPAEEEILKLLKYDSFALPGTNLKYSAVAGYGDQSLNELTINRDTTYYFEVTPREYTLTVQDVQNANGSKGPRQFKAKYGEKFDLSSLAATGADSDATKTYTAYFNTTATIDGLKTTRDVTEAVNRSFAQELLGGEADYTANYVDNSVTVMYQFVGAAVASQIVTIKKGTVPADTYSDDLTLEGKMVRRVDPAIGSVHTTTTYTVYCETTNAPKHTITYVTSGGSNIPAASYYEGAAINAPNPPTKKGYVFAGWFSDAALTTPYEFSIMPNTDMTLYAKWTATQYTVTFIPGEGTLEGDASKTVTFGSAYGTLPTATRTDGYTFKGWFTAITGGTEVKATTIYSTAANQTLYAQWKAKTVIQKGDVTLTDQQATYDQQIHAVSYTHSGGLKDFTVQYKMQNTDTWVDTATGAGTYDVRVTRTEDAAYARFDETYVGGLKINKAVRTVSANDIQLADSSFISLKTTIEVPDNRGKLQFEAKDSANRVCGKSAPVAAGKTAVIQNLSPSTAYRVFVSVVGDPNYEDATSAAYTEFATIAVPTTNWLDYADISWYEAAGKNKSIKITTAEQLAGLAKLTASGNSFRNWTFTLMNTVDLSAHRWTPIGNQTTYFSAIFKGNGGVQTVSGIYCENDYAGLFGTVSDAYLRGYVENVNITSSYIKGVTMAGGIAANSYYTELKNCSSDAQVVAASGETRLGGIAGAAVQVVIKNCQNDGLILGKDGMAAGIVGTFRGSDKKGISNCKNTGDVKGGTQVGGIVAYKENGAISSCYNTGSVTASGGTGLQVGGIAGHAQAVYPQTDHAITNCVNKGNVTSNGAEVGGIVGSNGYDRWSSPISRCYNLGAVTGTNYVGGIVGRQRIENGFSITGSYYLENCARVGNAIMNGVGKNGGSYRDDGSDSSRCINLASFFSPTDTLSRDAGDGAESLVKALKRWPWILDSDGYPIPENAGAPPPVEETPALRTWKKQPEPLPEAFDEVEEAE